jgi:hypothetical protein
MTRFDGLRDLIFVLELAVSERVVRLRRKLAESRGYRRATEDEIEALRRPHHNVQPRTFTPHTGEYGHCVGVVDDEWDTSILHLVGNRWRSGCTLKYFEGAFLFHGDDLDKMMQIQRENLEQAAEESGL